VQHRDQHAPSGSKHKAPPMFAVLAKLLGKAGKTRRAVAPAAPRKIISWPAWPDCLTETQNSGEKAPLLWNWQLSLGLLEWGIFGWCGARGPHLGRVGLRRESKNRKWIINYCRKRYLGKAVRQ